MTYRVGTSAKHGDVYVKGPVELRCGDYREVLGDVEPDAVICDPPYSERVEAGVRSGSSMKNQRNQIGMGYEPIDPAWCEAFADRWSRVPGWVVVYSDHIGARWHEEALARTRYTFAPMPLIKRGAAPRMCADGPSPWCEWIVVARPRSASFVGAWPGLPGFYEMQTVRHGHDHAGVRGAKSPAHMRQVVRDYSRPGDLVCDPTAGGATTLIAAALEGRRAIGAELDPETFAKACARIERTALTAPLPLCKPSRMTQEGLDL